MARTLRRSISTRAFYEAAASLAASVSLYESERPLSGAATGGLGHNTAAPSTLRSNPCHLIQTHPIVPSIYRCSSAPTLQRNRSACSARAPAAYEKNRDFNWVRPPAGPLEIACQNTREFLVVSGEHVCARR